MRLSCRFSAWSRAPGIIRAGDVRGGVPGRPMGCGSSPWAMPGRLGRSVDHGPGRGNPVVARQSRRAFVFLAESFRIPGGELRLPDDVRVITPKSFRDAAIFRHSYANRVWPVFRDGNGVRSGAGLALSGLAGCSAGSARPGSGGLVRRPAGDSAGALLSFRGGSGRAAWRCCRRPPPGRQQRRPCVAVNRRFQRQRRP